MNNVCREVIISWSLMRFVRNRVNAKPALGLWALSHYFKASRLAGFDERPADTEAQNAVALPSVYFHREIAHLNFAVGAVPGLIVKGNAEIERSLTVDT